MGYHSSRGGPGPVCTSLKGLCAHIPGGDSPLGSQSQGPEEPPKEALGLQSPSGSHGFVGTYRRLLAASPLSPLTWPPHMQTQLECSDISGEKQDV